MTTKAQGQVWWANLPVPLGWRPVLILTRTEALPKLLAITVAPLTRTVRGIDSEVELDEDDGVPTRCAVTLDNVATVDADSLATPICTLGVERMNEVCEALHVALDLPF